MFDSTVDNELVCKEKAAALYYFLYRDLKKGYKLLCRSQQYAPVGHHAEIDLKQLETGKNKW